MAMEACLQLVTDKEIDALVKDPTKLNALSNQSAGSYFYNSITFFLCGNAWPKASRKKPLTAMYLGFELVPTQSLENGNFGIVRPADVKLIADALAKVDLVKLKKQVEKADPEEMEEEECYDFELLTDGDEEDPGKAVVDDVVKLRKFYEKAKKLGRGVVMFSA
jgi:hypothetical protein